MVSVSPKPKPSSSSSSSSSPHIPIFTRTVLTKSSFSSISVILLILILVCILVSGWFHLGLTQVEQQTLHMLESLTQQAPQRLEASSTSLHNMNTEAKNPSDVDKKQTRKAARKRMPNIVVGGIMRNMNKKDQGTYLDYFLPKLLQLMKSISYRFHIIIYENDSTDGTREKILHYLGQTKNSQPSYYATLIFEDQAPGWNDRAADQNLLSIARTNRIAYARNQIIDLVRNTPALLQNFDYLYMMDMDGVCAGPNMTLSYDPQIFQYALLELKDQWDGIFFRFQPYYDLWALRIPELAPHNYWSGDGQSSNRIRNAHDLGPYLEQLPWPEGMMTVDSAFEMTGIYRMAMIQNTTARYNGVDEKDPSMADCEHVNFNFGLRRQYQARLRLSRLVYCQGDERYEPLPTSLVSKWSDYVSYLNRSMDDESDDDVVESEKRISSSVPHDPQGYLGYVNVIRMMNGTRLSPQHPQEQQEQPQPQPQ